MKLWTRDWLDSKELRRCSPLARAVLADLMCLANEGQPHGYLADKVGQLTPQFMASRCVISASQFARAVAELIEHGRLSRSENGTLFIQRMVEDEALRVKMAEGGRKGGNPNLVKQKVALEVNLNANLTDKHARARADSDSDSCVDSKKGGLGENGAPPLPSQSEYPLTIAEIRKHDPAVDDLFVLRLVQETIQYCLSHPKFPDEKIGLLTDAVFSRAVSESYTTGPPSHGTGLLLKRVPPIMVTGAQNVRH